MTKVLLPQAFWFRLSASCPRLEEIPRPDDKKRLLDLPAACALPDYARLEGRSSWAEVRLGWNPRGLGLVVLAEGVAEMQLVPDRPEGFADVQFWVDTRDTRDVNRATRFCHRFSASLRIRGAGRKLEVDVAQRPIARAVADAPMSKTGLIESRAELTRLRLDARALPARPGPQRFRPRDQSKARLRLSGLRPHARGPVPGRRPRLPHRREPQPLGDPGIERLKSINHA